MALLVVAHGHLLRTAWLDLSVTETPVRCLGDATLVCQHRRLPWSMALPNPFPWSERPGPGSSPEALWLVGGYGVKLPPALGRAEQTFLSQPSSGTSSGAHD